MAEGKETRLQSVGLADLPARRGQKFVTLSRPGPDRRHTARSWREPPPPGWAQQESAARRWAAHLAVQRPCRRWPQL